MSGILANSASKQMLSGDTSPSQTVSGFVTGEQIVLGAFPAGTGYQWGVASPSGSAAARSKLSSKTDAAPTFIPDVAGPYVLTVNVDGVTYSVQLTVVASATMNAAGGFRFFPLTRAAVPAPSSGHSLLDSQDDGFMAVKDANGGVVVLADRDWVNQAIATRLLNAPTLSVASTATVGDNVPATATTDDSDGYVTTGVDIYDGSTRLGGMTNAGAGSWTYSLNGVVEHVYSLRSRRITAIGYSESSTHTLTVSSQTNQPGVVQADTITGNVQVRDPSTDGTIEVGL
jgi:hypothetical protein